MKTFTKLIILPLTVLSCVRCETITVRGYEGGDAVINCPSQKQYKSFPKYLLRGQFRDGTVVIRSGGRAEWTHRGRVSLQDKKSQNIFTVTIHNLTLEDAGKYGCGVDTWGLDFHIKVSLEVASRPKPVIPKVTTRGSRASHSHSSASESDHTTDFQLDHTPVTSGELVYLSGGLIAALVLFFLLTLAVPYIKSRAYRKQASPSALPGNNRRESTSLYDSCMYVEIQHTSLNATDVPRQRDRRSSSALNTIYAPVMLALPSSASLATIQLSSRV